MPRFAVSAAMSVLVCVLGAVRPPDEEANKLVPKALEPFEHLIGAWRSHGIVEANKLQGWDETATWGWKFAKGKIVGMEITFKEGKYFSAATLDPLDTEGQYRLTATTSEKSKEVVYQGTLKGKNLTLVRQGDESSAPDQVTLQLLHDVRYTMLIEAKKSATTVKKLATIGATRADVRFGAAGKEEQGPKCIITGAPGTSTVSYQGQTYYVCCSGCRLEFDHDPEKWLRLAKEAKAKKDGGKSADERPTTGSKSKTTTPVKPTDEPESAKPDGDKKDPKSESGKTQKDKAKDKDSDSDSKAAAAALTRAKLLEKNGKRDAALQAYERVVKDFPSTVEAREAAEHIESLRKPTAPK